MFDRVIILHELANIFFWKAEKLPRAVDLFHRQVTCVDNVIFLSCPFTHDVI